MKGPAPTQLEALHIWLRARALRGLPIPSLDGIAREMDLTERNRVTELFRQGEARGLFRVEHGGGGQVVAIEAADGSWRAVRGGPAKPPKRKCLRCRQSFQPEHRHNFLCGCAELSAAPRGVSALRAGA